MLTQVDIHQQRTYPEPFPGTSLQNVSTHVSTHVSTNVSTDVAKTYVMTSTRTNDAGLETQRLMAAMCDGTHDRLACIVCGVYVIK